MARPANSRILLADDDPHFCRLIEHHLKSWGNPVAVVNDKRGLLGALESMPPEVLLLDVRLGEHDGIELLRELPRPPRGPEVVMLTAHGSIESAVTAMRIGAADYLTKPVDLARLRATLNGLLDQVIDRKKAAARSGQSGVLSTARSRPLLGESPAIAEVRQLIEQYAPTDATVLILGESGVGKELVARALHDKSRRAAGPFVPINVAALPRELVESTLFGHEKGAFTSAERTQLGCCEIADHGTLFLDEIGEMEAGLQAKLLRFLQERSFLRVGRSAPIEVDVRVVAATNRNPLELVRSGGLREDLYYRLNVLTIQVPPLRDRGEDVRTLASSFLDRAGSRYGKALTGFDPAALQAMAAHDWPGNVRELENIVERLAIRASSPVIAREAVAEALSAGETPVTTPAQARSPATANAGTSLREIDRIEKQAIVEALDWCGGNVREAARRLGLGQATVYRKIKRYGIQT